MNQQLETTEYVHEQNMTADIVALTRTVWNTASRGERTDD